MKYRRLGDCPLKVSAIGLGCMAMTNIYGEADEREATHTLHAAIDQGVNFLDCSDAYADGKNEEFLGRALKGRREQALVTTKFGNIRYPDGRREVNGRPEYVAEACEASLRRLGVDVIDLYYQHRVDPNVPIEDTVGAMAKLVEQGKVRYLGLSEAGAETIRRAHAVHPISALESEYSLWTRDAEQELLPTCQALAITYVAYSPLGRGFLTGTIRSIDSLVSNDRRREHPRFQGENFERNLALLEPLDQLAAAKRCTPAQIALAWVLSRGNGIVSIPGTKHCHYLEENIRAIDLTLDRADLERLNEAFAPGVASGTRYPLVQMKRMGL